jgi:hypothetical protein
MEISVRSMETAETAMETNGDGSGALPRPSRVPEQRLMSPEICLRWRWSYGTVLGKTPIVLGFSVGRLLIGEGASSGVDQGGLTMGGRSQGLGRAPLLCGQPLAPLRPPSGSRSVFGPLLGKIRLLKLVSFNSENISCVVFLKHKNSRKQGTDTVASC